MVEKCYIPDETMCNPGLTDLNGSNVLNDWNDWNRSSETQRATALARVRTTDESAGSRIHDDCVSAAEAHWIAADNLVPAALQLFFNFGKDLRFQTDFRRFHMVETRRRDCLLRCHAEIHEIGDDLHLHLRLYVAAFQTDRGVRLAFTHHQTGHQGVHTALMRTDTVRMILLYRKKMTTVLQNDCGVGLDDSRSESHEVALNK